MSQQAFDLTGYQKKQDEIRHFEITPQLQTIENQYPDRDYIVELSSAEFSSICPKTGLPDFANITIQYKPDKYLVEQKSFKLYLMGYRNVGIFQEHATNKIFDDFIQKVKPRWAKIVTRWNVRGGITTTVQREYFKDEE